MLGLWIQQCQFNLSVKVTALIGS